MFAMQSWFPEHIIRCDNVARMAQNARARVTRAFKRSGDSPVL